MNRTRWINVALMVPVVLVNVFAVYGQAGWALDHLFVRVPAAVVLAGMFAVTVESVGVYLAAEAHLALMAGDAALRLRVAAGAVAALVGGLNYHHYAPDLSPNTPAVTFAAMSAISPHLWAIRSRSLRRAELRAAGLVDARTVRFSVARWVLWFRPTWKAYRLAVWAGEQDPMRAIGLIPSEPEPRAEDSPAQDADQPAIEAPKPPRPNAEHARRVREVTAAIRKGDKPSKRSLMVQYRVGAEKATAILADATESAEASVVVDFGGAR